MFQVNEDNSIYVTRGDIVFFSVSAKDINSGEVFHFEAGSVLQVAIYEKKNCEGVVLVEDFPVLKNSESVEIYLGKGKTKIGKIINKPVDYWYEVVLNPYTDPQTIIGYSEDGPCLFRLFPEGAEIEDWDDNAASVPLVDKELDLLSPRPVANSAITAAIAKVESESKNFYVTPQMFGARGDGVTDDTEAFEAMISYIEANVPVREFPGEASCKDFTRIAMKFRGQYLINRPITFRQTYGVKIDGLNLIAGEGFSKPLTFEENGMLTFAGSTRTLFVSNTTINGNRKAHSCIEIKGYSLTTDFTNVELTGFRVFGLYATDKGHELKMSNVRISQYEWGQWEENKDNSFGVGLEIGYKHDCNFTNLVVSYCSDASVVVMGTANTFVNCHFYGSRVVNDGLYNVFQNCYFDGVEFCTDGFFTLSNCFFNRADGATTPFIFLTEESRYEWRYYQASINGTMFRATENVPQAIDYGDIGYLPEMNTIGNTFYYVEPFVSQSKGVALNPWQRPYAHVGEDEKGYIIISDIKFIWGTATANGFQEYPEGVTLTHTFYIGCQRMDGQSEIHPFANDIRENKFYLNGSANGKVKWLVIGR